jgi:hypothetical protein
MILSSIGRRVFIEFGGIPLGRRLLIEVVVGSKVGLSNDMGFMINAWPFVVFVHSFVRSFHRLCSRWSM